MPIIGLNTTPYPIIVPYTGDSSHHWSSLKLKCYAWTTSMVISVPPQWRRHTFFFFSSSHKGLLILWYHSITVAHTCHYIVLHWWFPWPWKHEAIKS
jgi:hypothetical protein